MNESEFIERAAAGIRALPEYYKNKLSGFVLANNEWYDKVSLLKFPVYFLSNLLSFRPYSDYPCPIFPIFFDSDIDLIDPAGIFARAFADYAYKEVKK